MSTELQSRQWDNKRNAGKATRSVFTDALKSHGIEGRGYAICTDTIYVYLFGRSAMQIRQVMRACNNTPIRDLLKRPDLEKLDMAESLAVDLMEEKGANGLTECNSCCAVAASRIRKTSN